MKTRTQKEQEETACERNDKIGWIGEYETEWGRNERSKVGVSRDDDRARQRHACRHTIFNHM